jgi:type IV pilus assembly protein PilB
VSRAEQRKLLGLSLVEAGYLTRDQLDGALKKHRQTGDTLGFTLLKQGFVTERQLLGFLTSKLGFHHANLQNYVVDRSVVNLVPEDIARKYQVFPLVKVKKTLTIAMVDPLDSFVMENLEFTTGCEIKPLVSTKDDIMGAIAKYYRPEDEDEVVEVSQLGELQKYAQNLQGTGPTTESVDERLKSGDKASIIALVDRVLLDAIRYKASDIHIEPEAKGLRVRYRIDGMLETVMQLSSEWSSSVVSRLKVMADLDIAEKRRPHDGRSQVTLEGREVDLRVSTFPTVFGEKAVLRILDKSNVMFTLQDLGYEKKVLRQFQEMIASPNGIFLLTGPTGSGKTSTLYAALNHINSIDKNITTIEDPVEYQLPSVNQSQVNPKAGFTFASGLRSLLRQDPDIIMVGEIRDLETGETAIRAALTGHLVFSTLHTNDAAGAITRLIDMGLEPFLVASSVLGTMAQRLVREICSECKEPMEVQREVLERLGASADRIAAWKFFQGRGCIACKETGYAGRLAISELLVMSETVRGLTNSKAPASRIKLKCREMGMRTLREDGLEKAGAGKTTLAEVLRVTQRDEI